MRAKSGTVPKSAKPSPPPAGAPNATIRFLAAFCLERPLDEKIFVVPSFIAGRQVGEALAREAGSWVNLRFVTLTSLAQEILERNGGAAARKPMTSSAELALTDRVFRELLGLGALEYFGRGGASPGLVRTIFRAVRDLRLDGLTSADLRPGLFLVERKGTELALILERYERFLEADGLLDAAGLLALALRTGPAAPSSPAWYLCPRDVRLNRLEADLVRAAAGNRLVLIPGDPVFGLERPRHCWPAPADPAATPSGASRLSWLFAPREAPAPAVAGVPEIFRALGPGNECREILRRLYAGKIPFDRVEVLAPPGSPHPTVFHLLSVRTGLPVTFGEGVPISFTSPGRLFFGLADWLADDLSVARLCRLLENSDLVLPAGAAGIPLPARTACRRLKAAMIGWGRGRYLERLRAFRDARQTDLEQAERTEEDETGEPREERLARDRAVIQEVEELSSAVGKLLDVIPEPGPEGGHGFQVLCEAFRRVIGEFGRSASELDRKAREILLARLAEVLEESRAPVLPLKEALDLLREAGASLRVGASPPLPGHLHVAGFSSGGLSGRPVTFVVGLDEATFPGRGLQDPVLLDEERAALSDSLPTAADSLRANLFALTAVLASLRGKVTLSYPSFDIAGERASFPSSVVLQAFRLGRGDADLDYSALERDLPEAAGFVPDGFEKAFDEVDWWLVRLAGEGRAAGGAAAVEANFADLAAGLAAAAARSGDRLTEYEGLVDIGPVRGKVDPVAGRKAVMSATRLELLARCPFGYFLRHVLGIRPPEDVEYDRSRWLDPRRRGSLFHEILYEFMTNVKERKESVDPARHGGLMDEIAGRHIGRAKQKVPPPSEGIFESERLDIVEALGIFLAAEAKRDEDVEPLRFEMEIRREEIDLGGGRSFLLNGFIDRLDRVDPNAYRILDYKTGSYAPFENLVEFGRGRVIQHALYAVAAEKILERERPGSRPRVTASGYFFPTRRGEGREIMVRNFDRDRLRRLLNDLLSLLEKGYFIAGTEARCGFCDFAPACISGGPEETEGKRVLLRHLSDLIEDECIIAGIRVGSNEIDLTLACGGNPEETKRIIEMSVRIFEAYDKLDEYK